MTRKLIAAALGLVLLAGCAGEPEPASAAPAGPVQPANGSDFGEFRVSDVQVGDRTVTCITWMRWDGGGISCDWSNPR